MSVCPSVNVNVNVKNHKGQTPLMLAASCGNESVRYFLCQVSMMGCLSVCLSVCPSVNVNMKNHKGQTPLMLAASCGNESVGYFLCQVRIRLWWDACLSVCQRQREESQGADAADVGRQLWEWKCRIFPLSGEHDGCLSVCLSTSTWRITRGRRRWCWPPVVGMKVSDISSVRWAWWMSVCLSVRLSTSKWRTTRGRRHWCWSLAVGMKVSDIFCVRWARLLVVSCQHQREEPQGTDASNVGC